MNRHLASLPPRVRAVVDHLDADRPKALRRFYDLLRIPTVSADPDRAGDMLHGARWVADALRQAGLEAKVHPTQGHPIVMGTTPAQSLLEGAADGTHVIFYGNYDVLRADPGEQWRTPPFEPTTRDGAIFARGASDDKGQVCCFLEAMRAWHVVHGGLPVRITVIIEGEEETSSDTLPRFLQEHRDQLHGDIVLISDTNMWDDSTVAITYGLWGIVFFDIKLHNSSRDLHSGMYGGVLANPLNELASVLGRLFDEQQRVTIPGFYDDVLDVTDEERARWRELGFDEARDCLGPVGVNTPFGEAGYTTLERKWARPACDINGLYGGYGGPGTKTVIPTTAGAKISFRLAPCQDPKKIIAAFRRWLTAQDVHGCRWEITEHGHADPVIVPTDSPHMQAVQAAVVSATGKPAVLVREGASIPIVAEFKRALGLDSILLGFARSDDAVHSPNEKFNLASFELGSQTHAVLLDSFSQMQ